MCLKPNACSVSLVIFWRPLNFYQFHKARFLLPCSPQSAACSSDGFSCMRTRGRIHTSTQHASKIAGNSIAQLVEMQRKLKYYNIYSTRCGLCGSMNRGFRLFSIHTDIYEYFSLISCWRLLCHCFCPSMSLAVLKCWLIIHIFFS